MTLAIAAMPAVQSAGRSGASVRPARLSARPRNTPTSAAASTTSVIPSLVNALARSISLPPSSLTAISAMPVTSCTIEPTSTGEKSKPVRQGICRMYAPMIAASPTKWVTSSTSLVSSRGSTDASGRCTGLVSVYSPRWYDTGSPVYRRPMSTRDRILDAAAEVMTERGIAATTTRAIARAAGCSEALLYKHFDDKQQIFLAVLLERMPTIAGRDDQASAATAAESLAELVHRMFDLFLRSFPMAVSIFGTPELLAEHRDSVRAHGYGPEGAI